MRVSPDAMWLTSFIVKNRNELRIDQVVGSAINQLVRSLGNGSRVEP